MIKICARSPWIAIACTGMSMLGHATDESAAAGSVLIQSEMPQRGSLPDIVVAYGQAASAVDATMTLSVPAEGRVMRIAVTTGEMVHAGQPLLDFRLAPAASSRHSQASTALALAREEQAATARLLSQQLATRNQLSQAAKGVSDAEAALVVIEAESGGPSLQIIKSPFNGVVSALPVAQGERLAAGAPLVTVRRDNGLVITAGIEPTLLRKVRTGENVSLTLLADAEPPEGESSAKFESALQGTVVRIDRVINPKTRLADVDIEPKASNSIDVLEGTTFRATIKTGEIQGWIVPRDAVLRDEHGDYLFQVADAKAVRIKVERLGGNDERSIVEGTLDPKRALVTSGNYQLSDGAAVRMQNDRPQPAGK